jgi:hypothetical protein
MIRASGSATGRGEPRAGDRYQLIDLRSVLVGVA